jgi:ClpP class serine protease
MFFIIVLSPPPMHFMNNQRQPGMGIWYQLAHATRFAFWLLLIVLLLLQVLGGGDTTQKKRDVLLEQFQNERKSRVIALIHRQESRSILGVPVSSYINIEDSEAVLRAIRFTPDEQPIDLILHTPGGLVLAAEQIAKALAERKGKVTVFIPHYAMSGGTLIALAADEIVMDRNAVLGPVDPQIGDVPAASILQVLKLKKPEHISDETIMLADMAAKSRVQVASFVAEVLTKRLPRNKAEELAIILSEGRWTHDFPVTVQFAKQLGLPVTTEMPRIVYELMDLYPQANTRRPSVVYVPVRGLGENKNEPVVPGPIVPNPVPAK